MTFSGWLVTVVGALLLAVGVAWRTFLVRRAHARLLEALDDPDPRMRAAAVEVVGTNGIGRYAEVLRVLAQRDPSVLVRRRVAEVVVRNQWEPASSDALVDLRLTVQRQLDVAGDAHDRQDGPGTAETSADPAEARPHPSSRGRMGWSLIVLVTGAGGPAGTAVIRALQKSGHRVVAVDADPLAVGLRLAQRAAIVPRADDDRFVEVLLEVARSTGASVLVSTVAEEVSVLYRNAARLREAGIAHFLPDPESVRKCLDKWKFAQILRAASIPTPATSLAGSCDVPGPWIVKPRFGRGSRDVHLIDDAEELRYVVVRVPDPIVQTRVTGREFTVDTLSAPDGELLGAVPRWRLETRGGISTKGETFSSPQLVADVEVLLRTVGLSGPANVQGFEHGDGRWSFIEVNPRFSGGLPLSLAAGADLVGEYVRLALGNPPRPDRLCFRPGVRMTRHFEDIFES